MNIDNQRFYTHSFKKHGLCPQGLSWNSKQSQEIRFQVLCEFLQEELLTCKLVDAGCGFADFYLYLEKIGLKPQSYIGIDSLEKFIKISQKRVPKAEFLHRDILKDDLPKAHWYIASGSLNILSDFDTWLFLEKMLCHASKGVVFNILQGTKNNSAFNYKTKEEMVQFAKQKDLAIEIKEGYLPKDMSIKLSKEMP